MSLRYDSRSWSSEKCVFIALREFIRMTWVKADAFRERVHSASQAAHTKIALTICFLPLDMNAWMGSHLEPTRWRPTWPRNLMPYAARQTPNWFCKAAQSNAKQSNALQHNATKWKINNTKQSKATQCKTKQLQSNAKPCNAVQSKVKQCRAMQSDAEQWQAKQ